MSQETVHSLIILGAGPAGLTAGIYAGRALLKPLIIEGKKPGGQLMGTSYIENWPGEKHILGPQLMIHIQEHAKATGCTFLSEEIVSVNFKKRPFELNTNKNKSLLAHAVIIATGATPKRLGCPGEDLYWGKGVSTCAVCDGAFYKDQPVVIIGGGDTAMENAAFMSNFTQDITIVHIGDEFTASPTMQERVKKIPSLKTLYQSTVVEIKGDGNHVTSVIVQHQKTQEKKELKVSAAFIAIGLMPNTIPFKGQLDLLKNGYINVTDHTHTSVPGIFCAGDVADFKYRQAITSAGTGCMAALDAERYLKEQGSY